MTLPRQYASAHAFRNALETRLLERSRRSGADLQRLRRQVAFDRLLARLFDPDQASADGWVLKGGYALELRLSRARSTKDVDLTIRPDIVESSADANASSASRSALRERFQRAATRRLPDFFMFAIGEGTLELNRAPKGGTRFPVDGRLDGRTFARFHVDIAFAEQVLEPLDTLVGDDWLGFAGIPPAAAPALSAEQHWAEKLHAFTVPRDGPNTRVKDLVDLVLLIEHQHMDRVRLLAAVELTFSRRDTHPLPEALPAPPAFWERSFGALAAECGLSCGKDEAHARVQVFWREVCEERERLAASQPVAAS